MDFNSVQGKVVIVTGASRGIGRAIAECYGAHGMKVACAARSVDQGQAVSDGICAKGGEAIFIQTDCSSTAAIKELVDKTVAHYGKLDGVVSNAGIGMGGTPLHEYDVTDYEKIFALNSEGVFAGMKYGAEAILKSHSEGGFLINVASIAGLVPQRGQALYSATKFGVVGMTRAAALDYAAYGIVPPQDDLFDLVEKFRDGTCPMPRLFLACGQQDSLYPANLRLRDTLQAMNWPLTWYEAPGDHNWFFWNDALGRAMKELLEN
jgi:NADP-dependent 3-hydroxy acid dehydrogenase YdfG